MVAFIEMDTFITFNFHKLKASWNIASREGFEVNFLFKKAKK